MGFSASTGDKIVLHRLVVFSRKNKPGFKQFELNIPFKCFLRYHVYSVVMAFRKAGLKLLCKCSYIDRLFDFLLAYTYTYMYINEPLGLFTGRAEIQPVTSGDTTYFCLSFVEDANQCLAMHGQQC